MQKFCKKSVQKSRKQKITDMQMCCWFVDRTFIKTTKKFTMKYFAYRLCEYINWFENYEKK